MTIIGHVEIKVTNSKHSNVESGAIRNNLQAGENRFSTNDNHVEIKVTNSKHSNVESGAIRNNLQAGENRFSTNDNHWTC